VGNPAHQSSDVLVGLPDVEKLIVAGGGQVNATLPGSAAESGANVLFGIRKLRERNFESRAWLELRYVSQKPGNDLLVLAISSFRDIDLEYRFKLHRICIELAVVFHDSLR